MLLRQNDKRISNNSNQILTDYLIRFNLIGQTWEAKIE